MQSGAERRKGPLAVLVGAFAALSLGLFLVVGLRGAEAAAKGERVLGVLDPAFNLARTAGRAALVAGFEHALFLGGAVAVLSAALAIAGLRRTPRDAALPLLALGVALAGCGEALLLSGRGRAGAVLLGAGAVAALALGLVRPLRKLAGFPGPPSADPASPVTRAEVGAVFGLVVAGLLVRAWALTELPSLFDDEPIYMLVQSATLSGLKRYFETELLGTGNGIFHLITNFFFYRLFGGSCFTVRLTALFWGVAAIPLFYGLIRRLAGRGPALLGTLLFVCAPEQLFWSRNENSFFSLVAIVALVTAHLTLWLVRSLSFGAALATAVWMPVCRFFYTPSFVMFTLPLILLGHALLFQREARRRAWFLVPTLLGGLALWIFSLSLFLYPVRGRWEFIHPAKVRGEVAWRGGIAPDAPALTVAKVQAARIATNAASVVRGLADHQAYSSHWYGRFHVSGAHRSDVVAGLFVLSLLAAAWLLVQPGDLRAVLLLAWLGIGLLPAVMSDEPEARRFALVFPALLALSAVFAGAAARIVRSALRPRGGPLAARLAVGGGTALVAAAGLASHLSMPVRPLEQEAKARFVRPLFLRCDTVFHNLFYRQGPNLALSNLDRLLLGPESVCYQRLVAKDWPSAALFPDCDLKDEVFTFSLSSREIARRKEKLRSGRVGFLLADTIESRPEIELLRRLYPEASVRRESFPETSTVLVAIEVDGAAFRRHRTVEVGSRTPPPATLLRDVASEPGSAPAAGLEIRGGVLVPLDGFYRLALDPPCAAATLASGVEKGDAVRFRPWLAGVHPFTLRLMSADDCPLPLKLAFESPSGGPLAEARVVSPRLLDVPGVAAPPAVTEAGFGEPVRLARFDQSPVDVAVDGAGVPTVLLFRNGIWRLRRVGAEGDSFEIETGVSRLSYGVSLAVSADGTSAVAGPERVELYDRRGRRVREWSIPYREAPGDVVAVPGGGLLLSFPYRQSVELFSEDGALRATIRTADGPDGFSSPQGLALSPRGDLVVLDGRGDAHVFSWEKGSWPPRRRLSFHVGFAENPLPDDAARVFFSGPDRLFFPHHSHSVPLWYTLSGARVLAATPDGDLASRGVGGVRAGTATADALFLLEGHADTLLRVVRR